MRAVIPEGHVKTCALHDEDVAAQQLAEAINTRTVTDAYYQEHYDYITCVADELEMLNINTRTAYSTREAKHNWVYDSDRAAVHQQIIEEETSRWETVPRNRQAVLTGGLIGSGKTSTLRHHSKVDLNDYVLISADLMKITFAEKGLVPNLKGFTPLEASVLCYKETNHVVWTLFERAVEGGWNLVFDTMMGAKEATIGKLEPMNAMGYEVDGLFVDVSIDTAIRRTKMRHRIGFTRFVEEGVGFGGRLLPITSITEQALPVGSKYRSVNRQIFAELVNEGAFRNPYVYENDIDGKPPRLLT